MQLLHLSQPQILQEQRARMPEAIATQPLRAQPGIRPQAQAQRQVQQQRLRMTEAQSPRQSRAERPERRALRRD